MPFDHDLFLAHAPEDRDWAGRLAQRLEADSSGPPLRVRLGEAPSGAGLAMPLASARGAAPWRGLVLTPSTAAQLTDMDLASTAPGESELLPLLLATCELPNTLLPLRRIDFRYAWEQEQRLNELVLLLRSGPPRLSRSAEDPALLSADVEAMRALRPIFEHDVFWRACVQELQRSDLEHAVEHMIISLNTGKRYARDGLPLGDVPDRTRFRTELFRASLMEVAQELQILRHDLIQPNGFQLWDLDTPGGFYAAALGQDGLMLRVLVQMMDAIDHRRNLILGRLNRLLEAAGAPPLPLMQPSSALLCRSDRPRDMALAIGAGLRPRAGAQRAG